jgi:hypothetical protein
MLAFLDGRVSRRQLRLFACACCREALSLFADERASRAVAVAERLADGLATETELADAAGEVEVMAYEAEQDGAVAYRSYFEESDSAEDCPIFEADAASLRCQDNLHEDGDAGFRLWEASVVAGATALVAEALSYLLSPACAWREAVESARTAARRMGRPIDMRLSRLLRDILGDPFRRVALDPMPGTATMSSLAQAIYDERPFDRPPILADALEEAGCTDPAILAHLRGPGPHVRGCWMLDLILGKA